MSRLNDVFARREGRAALVAYFCAGDPDPETTVEVAIAAAEEGADILELGMPFSDPAADGVAIQRASERALKRGMTLRKTLEVARAIRARSPIPIVLFGYYNPILAYGEGALCRDAAAAGIDALLVVDLPPEEIAPLRSSAQKAGLALVPLIAPTSSEPRIDLAASVADAFLYYVSLTGVTGAASADFAAASKRAQHIKERTKKPVVVGFGVSTGKDVAQLAKVADGVVVGSALVKAVESASDRAQAVANVRTLVKDLVSGLRG
ncbi:MAG TPA: tryptophan synthase subunit alpha [Polyangiales bacterium]|nr:tryptophan synthase subunit alpha [Polyangiales bacterium]